jgi:translation elongation factor EF-Tu-like GTPase
VIRVLVASLLAAACAPKTVAPPPPLEEPAPAPSPPPVVETPPPAESPASEVSFAIEDSFHIAGRGPVVLGRVVGHVEVGDRLTIQGSDPAIVVEVLAVELQRERNATPTPDMPASLLLRLPAASDRSVLARGATLVRAK